jgi:hypothetical protein
MKKHVIAHGLIWLLAFAPMAYARDSDGSGRLIVLRSPNFTWDCVLNVKIDGRTVANVVIGQRYDGFLPAGQHVLTVMAVPNPYFRWPTPIPLTVRPGQTYVFTARWESDQVSIRPSVLPLGQTP